MAKKKKFKGKYPGPDKYKGDKKKLAAYRASKRRAAAPAARPAAAAPPPGVAGQTPTPVNPGAVASNSSGTIQLQTNLDIENAALDNEEALRQAEDQAAQLKAQSLLQEQNNLKMAEQDFRSNRGRMNAVMAYRGMRGDTAADKSEEVKSAYDTDVRQIKNNRLTTDTEADNIATQARDFWRRRKGMLDLERQRYTNERSATNPTAGSQAENAGVSAIRPPARKASSKSTPAKKYKGKYPGPDKFKGNKRKIAAWKAAKRKAK